MAELAFVQKALTWGEESAQTRRKREGEVYEGLIVQLRSKESAVEEVEVKKAVFLALARCAPRLMRNAQKHSRLLDAIFEAETVSPDVIKGLNTTLSSLASHKSITVVRGFETLLRLAAKGEASFLALEAIVDGLSGLLTLCPQGVKELWSAMKKQYPWSGKSMQCHTAYVEVLLALTERHKLLEAYVLELIVRNALEIDTLINASHVFRTTNHHAVLGEKNKRPMKKAFDQHLFDFEPVPLSPVVEAVDKDHQEAQNKTEESKEEEEEEEEEESELSETAEKLDAVMLLLLRYLDARLVENADTLLSVILDVFETAILQTHESKFVQFAIFKVCASTRQRASVLVHFLLRRAANTTRVVRLPAVAYLASFVCRARAVDAELAYSCASALLIWCEATAYQLGLTLDDTDLKDSREKKRSRHKKNMSDESEYEEERQAEDNDLACSFALSASIDNMLVHSPNSLKRQLPQNLRKRDDIQHAETTPKVFAALLQALLYLVCFRGDEILCEDLKDTISQSNETPMFAIQNVCDSERWYRLLSAGNADGLKRCDRRVKTEFLKVCERADHVFSQATLTAIKALAAPSALPNDGEPPFFFYPFDPYLLPKSRAYLGGGYRHWAEDDDSDYDDDSVQHEAHSCAEDQHSADENASASLTSLSPPGPFRREDQQKSYNASSPPSLSNSVISIDGHFFSDRRHAFTPGTVVRNSRQSSEQRRRPRLDSSSIGRESW